MLAENPYKEGFGKVNYHLKDVTEVDLGHEVYDAVSGWSAFHHIPDLHGFMDRVWHALKPGGIVATLDDMELGSIEKWLGRGFRVMLPSYNRTYREKVRVTLGWLRGKIKPPEHIFSPMEAEKYSTVHDIEDIWMNKFELIERIRINAFAAEPAMTVSGPDIFRYTIAQMLVGLDRFLCQVGICRGFERILIARKKWSSPIFS